MNYARLFWIGTLTFFKLSIYTYLISSEIYSSFLNFILVSNLHVIIKFVIKDHYKCQDYKSTYSHCILSSYLSFYYVFPADTSACKFRHLTQLHSPRRDPRVFKSTEESCFPFCASEQEHIKIPSLSADKYLCLFKLPSSCIFEIWLMPTLNLWTSANSIGLHSPTLYIYLLGSLHFQELITKASKCKGNFSRVSFEFWF